MSDLQELIGKSIAPPYIQKLPDELTQKESDDLATEAKLLELQAIKDSQNHQRDEHKQRVTYAKRIFTLIKIWLVIVMLIVICSGIKCLPFSLSDRVLITLLTTTTITVLGLFITVLKYIYGRKDK